MDFLSNLNTMLTSQFGPLGPFLAIGLLGLALILVTLPSMLKKQEDPLAKLKAQREGTARAAKASGGADLRRGQDRDKLEKFAGFLEPQDAETMSASRLKMLRAGYRAKNAVRMFHFAQFALGLGFLALGMI